MISRNFYCTALGLAAIALFAGCGEQDLYEPPESPYRATGRVPLASEATGVDVLGDYAFVSCGQSGLQVVDVSDPAHPVLVGSEDTGKFADAVRVVRVYAADGTMRDVAFLAETTEGIATIDVTDPSNPFTLGGGETATDAENICVPAPISVGDELLVFLAESWKGIRLFFFDPMAPSGLELGTFVSTHGYVKALDVVEGFAFAAEDQMGVTVLDVRDPRTGGFLPIFNIDTQGNATDIYVEGEYAYVADGPNGLQIFAIDAEHHLTLVGSLTLAGDCCAVRIRNEIAYVAAEDGGVHIVNVRNPANPVLLGTNAAIEAVGVAVTDKNVVCVADAEDGLLVFMGATPPLDTTAPAAVTDLRALALDVSSVELSWTAPGDDGASGRADLYYIRRSLIPITADTWGDAEPILQRPFPLEAGAEQSFVVAGLEAEQTYYFALRSQDESGNLSDLSNVPQATLAGGALSGMAVSDSVGGPATVFQFTVTYFDAGGQAPQTAVIVIDGQAFSLQPVAANPDYTEPVQFIYSTTLGYGTHEHQFRFAPPAGLEVRSQVYDAPDVQLADPLEIEMIDVATGIFMMGSPASEAGRDGDREQLHQVTLTRDFAISETEINQALYAEIMDANPSYHWGPTRPVHNVTWYDAIAFCNALSTREALTPVYTISGQQVDGEGHLVGAIVTWNPAADGYRLPTEAEWEFACRAGTTTALWNGDLTVTLCGLDPLLDATGWYCGNADLGLGPKSRSAAQKEANALGLVDMHGNVAEWCWDWFGAYPETAVSDPTGPVTGERRVCRGGSWFYYARDCRSAARGTFFPSSHDDWIGFRVVRTLP